MICCMAMSEFDDLEYVDDLEYWDLMTAIKHLYCDVYGVCYSDERTIFLDHANDH